MYVVMILFKKYLGKGFTKAGPFFNFIKVGIYIHVAHHITRTFILHIMLHVYPKLLLVRPSLLTSYHSIVIISACITEIHHKMSFVVVLLLLFFVDFMFIYLVILYEMLTVTPNYKFIFFPQTHGSCMVRLWTSTSTL